VLRAPVPETAVNEHSHALPGKQHVSLAPDSWERSAVDPVPQPNRVQRGPQEQLGGGVTAPVRLHLGTGSRGRRRPSSEPPPWSLVGLVDATVRVSFTSRSENRDAQRPGPIASASSKRYGVCGKSKGKAGAGRVEFGLAEHPSALSGVPRRAPKGPAEMPAPSTCHGHVHAAGPGPGTDDSRHSRGSEEGLLGAEGGHIDGTTDRVTYGLGIHTAARSRSSPTSPAGRLPP
jgi:hypothetical protein